jgi:hypothetical protein
MARGLLGVLLAFAISRVSLAAEIGELTIDAGWISAIAIAPAGKGIALGIEGASDDIDRQEAEVRWWNWNGKDGRWASPSIYVSALAWDRDGFLLAAEREPNTRTPEAHWWRLGPAGTVLLECKATPRFDGLIHAEEHGIHSIAALANGKVVTGGVDATLAVWEGCSPAWLHSGPCCHGGHNIRVAPDGNGFVTAGEAIYRGDERGFEELGARRWTPDPWRAAPGPVHVIDPELTADGDDCSAILDNTEGGARFAVGGSRPWEIRIDAAIWKLYEDKFGSYRLAVSRDCTAVALAVDKRLVWAKSP